MNLDAVLRIKADVQGENNIRRLGNSMQGLQGQVKNTADRFLQFKGAVAGIGAAITGSAVVAGLGSIVKKSIDAGDELFNLQAKTGIAASALTGIGNAAKLADLDIGALGKGLSKLNVNLVRAAEGDDELARKFAALGVSVKDANGNVIPADKALKQIADRFADMPDGAQKAAAAVALFGKSGADLIPLLNDGAAAMEKFTYKVSEDFAARSDLFNDTITQLGIKAQGFGLELTDALLPALQSILEVFSDLFDTKQDWTALFDVIRVGIRSLATLIYATIKLVDNFAKTVVMFYQAVGKAIQGDFAGAAQIIQGRIANLIEGAKRDFAQIQKIWTDAPSPGTGRRTGGRQPGLDTTRSDLERAAAADRAAAAAIRREDQLAALRTRSLELLEELQNKAADANRAAADVGLSPVKALFAERENAMIASNRQIDEYTKTVIKLRAEFERLGVGINLKPFEDAINALSEAGRQAANADFWQGIKDLLPSFDSYNTRIDELQRGKKELTEVEKLNALVNMLQLDILAATYPELEKYIRLLRERAKALDDATAAQKKDGDTINEGIGKRLQEYYNSIKDIGGAIGDAVVGGLKGLEDQLTEFVTTGKASFADLARSILSDLARIALRAAIIQPIVQAIGGMFPSLGLKFAMGGVMTEDGAMPLKRYAAGGIARSPQLAMFGEGSQPEAFVPLPDGRRIPVAMQGGSAGATTVNVSVDATGSQVQGDAGKSNQLGRAVAAAVQAELIKQKRPGGLLVS